MFIVRLNKFQTTPPLFGLSSFLYLPYRDFGCGKAMCFDDLFRKGRPNKTLQLAALFNSSLDGNVRRAIDIHEGDNVDEVALKDLIRAAVALNVKGKSNPKPRQAGPLAAGPSAARDLGSLGPLQVLVLRCVGQKRKCDDLPESRSPCLGFPRQK
jgi:hypothetical protein